MSGQLKLVGEVYLREHEELVKWRDAFSVSGAAHFVKTKTTCSITLASPGQTSRVLRDETIWAQIGTAHTVGTNTIGYEWSQMAPATNGTFVAVTGGLVSGTNDTNLAIPTETPTTTVVGKTFLLRRGFDPDPAVGKQSWGFEPGGGGGSGTIPVLCTGTVSAGVYIGKVAFTYTNVAQLDSGQTISGALTPKPELAGTEVFLGNFNEFNYSSTNTATGEALRVGSMYLSVYYTSTNHTARTALYMTQGADGIVCS